MAVQDRLPSGASLLASQTKKRNADVSAARWLLFERRRWGGSGRVLSPVSIGGNRVFRPAAAKGGSTWEVPVENGGNNNTPGRPNLTAHGQARPCQNHTQGPSLRPSTFVGCVPKPSRLIAVLFDQMQERNGSHAWAGAVWRTALPLMTVEPKLTRRTG